MSPLVLLAVAGTLTVIAAAVGLARRDAAANDEMFAGLRPWEPPAEDTEPAAEPRGLRLVDDDTSAEDVA